MRVHLLGSTGLFGKAAAGLLADAELVTEIAIASRRLEAAQRTAWELGDKAHAVRVNIKDQSGLTSIAGDYDIVVNAAGPMFEVQVPALRAAIEADADYCDLGVDGNATERALRLDTQARARPMTAVLGIGLDPGLSNLLAVHAAHQMDEIEELYVCILGHLATMGSFSPEASPARMHQSGRIDTAWQDVLEIGRGRVLMYREGHWMHVEPIENPVEIVLPSGASVTAYPVGTSEPVTLPRHLSGVKTVSTLSSFFPPQLNELYLREGRRIAKGETDPARATLSFLETIVADKARWLSGPPGFPSGWTMWVTATGRKGGRRARYLCWPDALPVSTTAPLVACVLQILRGQVDRPGVLPPEACFEPQAFFAEAVRLRPPASEGPLLGESFQYLN
ncbi:MAG: saccharopine dehydrogenase family protein [bacterium]